MLIELSIENFRSIRARQTLSLVAASRLKKKENTINHPVTDENFPALLKAAAIYGPNASGKSTIFLALKLLSEMARAKPSPEATELPVSPFRFDPVLRHEPSRFEVHFAESGLRYTFELALTAKRIHQEKLTVYNKGRAHLLYDRTFDGSTEQYAFGKRLEGGADLHDIWQKLTGPQVLFLSQSVANSSTELQQLRQPYLWLADLMFESQGMKASLHLTQQLISQEPAFGQEVADLLSDVDVPVTAIRTTRDEVTTTLKTTLTHKTVLDEVDFDLSEESDGTKNLMGFALPWFVFRHSGDGAKNKVLFVDELDSSLHPRVVQALIERHINSELGCQLIFTTHDTHLMDTRLLRRDQIWFTERNAAGATDLRCAHDFEGRESEDLEKRYYEGRYRALPFVRQG